MTCKMTACPFQVILIRRYICICVGIKIQNFPQKDLKKHANCIQVPIIIVNCKFITSETFI